jgi:hypothetical protein
LAVELELWVPLREPTEKDLGTEIVPSTGLDR